MALKELTQLRVIPTQIANAQDPNGRASVAIYRPFFLAGILSVLTAGCALGAIALLGIGLQGSFTASFWTPYVLAHANSQLYGWVGFFVMGFALQQHPPRNSKVELFHKLAKWSLGLMAAGIALRFVAEPMVKVDRDTWLPIGVISGLSQAVAVALFLANTSLTRHKTGEGLSWQSKFVFCSLFWLFAVSVAEPWFFSMSHQADPTQSIMFVAEYFPAYREAQFLGFVAMMIFGVALVKMNSCFGAQRGNQKPGNAGFYLWNVGLVLRMVGWGVYFRGGLAASAMGTYYLGGVLLAVAATLLVSATRMLEPLETKLPAHKFVRGAFAWLLIAGVMLILEPLHLRAIGEPFSHAFIGAIRHAVTVGFISQMILGVGMHVVSKMNDLPESAQPPLWSVFILLNLGNAARVGLEVLTDYTPGAFLPMGVTGFVELTALAIWAYYVAKPMLARRRLAHA